MSLSKRWSVKECDEEAVIEIADALGLYTPVAALLAGRGYCTVKDAKRFIDKENASLYDAFLLPDMDKAVVRIDRAINEGERIAVYGDYDVDGITAVSVIYSYLRSQGADVIYYIPDRMEEGYGVNREALDGLKNEGAELIITVDTGITANSEVEYAKEIGIDIVITDHHECKDTIPDAAAAVNPKRSDSKYPFRDLAGVGVAFKLVCALSYYAETGTVCYSKEFHTEYVSIIGGLLRDYSDLVSLGTVADVMPLTDENRVIVSYGLYCMAKTKNTGLKALLEASEIMAKDGTSKKINSGTVGFILAPRINAIGRISKATRAVELFLTSDKKEAEAIAAELCDANKHRQDEENVIASEAIALIEEQYEPGRDKMIVIGKEGWHHGIVGIVSSRITERYNLPSILISFDAETGIGKGSGRSISEFNLVGALTECGKELEKFGGHTLAAGLTVKRENFEKFKKEITEYANSVLTDDDVERKSVADREIYPEDITSDLVDQLSVLEPYGTANPTPVFFMRELTVTEISPISNGKHLRISLSGNGEHLQAMYFGMNQDDLLYTVGDRVDILCNLSLNEFKGNTYPRIIIRDMRFSHEILSEYESLINFFDDIRSGFLFAQDSHVPTRDECAEVFRYITRCKNENNIAKLNLHKLLYSKFKAYNYVKLRCIIEIFTELKFISYSTQDKVMFNIYVEPDPAKAPLTASPLFQYLNGQKDD